jgi:hypothetical protein
MGLVGVLLILAASPHGLGVRGDSVTYMAAAENMLTGRGFSRPTGIGVKPLTHFPPLFPALLALERAAGIPLTEAARWTNALLFGINIVLLGWMVVRMTGRPWVGVAGAALALVSPTLVRNHLWVMSEPLFLTLCLVSLLALASYLESGQLRLLLVAAAAASLALLNRYAAAGLAASGVLGLLGIPGASNRRARDVIVYSLIVSVPTVLWFVRNARVAGTATNRNFVFHPLTSAEWKAPVQLIWTWLLPFNFTTAALYGTALTLGVLLLGGLALLIAMGGHGRSRAWAAMRSQALVTLVALFIGCYTVMVLITKLFLDAATPIDERIAMPVFAGMLALALTGWSWLERRSGRSRWFLGASTVLLGMILLSYAPRSARYMYRSLTTGLGYTISMVLGSDVSQAAAELDPSLILYTNEPELLYFLTHRNAYMNPNGVDTATLEVNSEFAEDLREMQERIDRGEAGLVIYSSLENRPDLPPLAQLAQGRDPYFVGNQGSIYLVPVP